MSSSDRRALIHLLDLLCEHEESVIESCTFCDGELDRRDAASAQAVQRSRRIWKRAQSLIETLEHEGKVHAHAA